MKSNISINLESLLELGVKLNETKDNYAILNLSLLTLMGKLRYLRACVLVPDGTNENFNILISKGSLYIKSIPFFPIETFKFFNVKDCNDMTLLDSGFQLCFPVIFQKELFAVICLGNRIIESELTEDELYYAKLVSIIAANAVQNAKNNLLSEHSKVNLEKRNQLLQTLFDLSKDFSSFHTKHQYLRMLSYHLMGQLMVTRFAIFLQNNENDFEPIVNRFEVTPPNEVVEHLLKINKTMCTEKNCVPDDIIKFLESISAPVVTPMKVQGATKGVLIVGKKMNGDTFTDENMQFLEALGNTALAAIENERLFQEEVEKKRLESELTLALEIQKNLLPKQLPHIEGYQFAGLSVPFRHVGGDYYDFIKLNEHEILIAIADVSGKGMPAALLMANVQAALRVLAPINLGIKDLIYKINDVVFQNTTADKFVTFFCGILNSKLHTFNYINAGHNPPLLLKQNGSFNELSEGGLILGFSDEKFPYSKGCVDVEKGDLILFYTDGVTETQDSEMQEFGEERLKKVIKDSANHSSEILLKLIYDTIKSFSSEINHFDDITLAVVKAV